MEPYGVQDERRLAKVDAVPITGAHLPPPPSVLEAAIPAAGMPRANRAPSIEKPQGSPTSPPNATVLQQHCMWFDRLIPVARPTFKPGIYSCAKHARCRDRVLIKCKARAM
eukprot:scaffold24245_cov17-Tisochrysis_lutea.AAC.1